MKKILLISIMGLSLLLTACGGKKNILDTFYEKIENTSSYYINGELEISNNEDTYTYDVKVSYKKDDLFKVSLKNKTNNHEQIILKNTEGVYVKTQESTKQK